MTRKNKIKKMIRKNKIKKMFLKTCIIFMMQEKVLIAFKSEIFLIKSQGLGVLNTDHSKLKISTPKKMLQRLPVTLAQELVKLVIIQKIY